MSPHVDVKHPRCPYCHAAITPDDVKTPCMTCMAWHHSACADEHERCAACGGSTEQKAGGKRVRHSGSVRYAVFQSSWQSWDELCYAAAQFASRRDGDLLNVSHSHRSTEGLVSVWYGASGLRAPRGRSRVMFRRFESAWQSWDELFENASGFASSVGERLISISHSGESTTGLAIVWYWD